MYLIHAYIGIVQLFHIADAMVQPGERLRGQCPRLEIVLLLHENVSFNRLPRVGNMPKCVVAHPPKEKFWLFLDSLKQPFWSPEGQSQKVVPKFRKYTRMKLIFVGYKHNN